ncbi:amidohydrolase family protein [Dactylosporangium sp. McL0621]|uniref:amidohydrolase family protein n=1 Tax=Dactylosporangium sp. McL0621 TaxID=3415678 RepID=UPI003CF090C2
MQPVQPDEARPAGSISEALPIIDTHIHLWDQSRIEYPWLARWPQLGTQVAAHDLVAAAPALAGAVFIEASPKPADVGTELAWLAEQATRCPFPVRIVVQADPSCPTWWTSVADGAQLVRGVRQVMHMAPEGSVSDLAFVESARAAGEAGLSVDLTVRYEQLDEVAYLCRAVPATTFVLDHLGKPAPHDDRFDTWARTIENVSASPNVVCKLSSIAVHPGNPPFRPDVAGRHLSHALQAFGADRCVYGTDWPVVTQATSYQVWLELVLSALAPASTHERAAVLAGNARRVYGFDQQ